MSRLTEELLSTSLPPGTARAEVIAKFGEPVSHKNIDEGVLEDYRYKAPMLESWESKLSGFQVIYKNERVVKWFPTYSHRSITAPVAPDPETVKAAGLSFRVANQPEGELDSQRPDLVIHTIKSVALSTNTAGKQSVILELCDADNLRMKALTENSVGKTLIFSVADEPLGRWLIMGPLQNNRYEIGNVLQERVAFLETLLRGFVGTCPQTNATPIPPS